MTQFNDVTIYDKGDGQFELRIDGQEVHGVRSYEIKRDYKSLAEVKIHFFAGKVSAQIAKPQEEEKHEPH